MFPALAGHIPKGTTRTVIISGKIQDIKNNELLTGVKINCETCQKTIYSNLQGKFFVSLEVSSTQDIKLEFSQIGYSTQIITLPAGSGSSGNLEISLLSE